MTKNEAFVIAQARNLLATYTVKMGSVLDAERRVIHHVNAVQVGQLQRAIWTLEDEGKRT